VRASFVVMELAGHGTGERKSGFSQKIAADVRVFY
jgi:hypothetical protein